MPDQVDTSQEPAVARTTRESASHGPASSESAPQDSEFDPGEMEKLVSENPQVYSMLIAAVSREVMVWLEDTRSRRLTALLASGSIVVAVLLAIGGFLINQLLQGLVDTAVDDAIEANQEANRASDIFQSRVAALNFRALRLDEAEGFSQEDADDLVQSVESLYESGIGNTDDNVDRDVRLRNIADLTFAVETIANSFAQADRDDLISQITDVAPDVTERSAVMTQLIVQVRGRNLIGIAGGANAWTTGTDRELYTEYRDYAERARQTGFPELYLVFELITRHMQGRPNAEVRELVADVADLNEVDQNAFEQLMRSLVDGSFVRSPTAASRRIQARTREFLEDYETESLIFGLILATVPDTTVDVQDVVPISVGSTQRYSFEPDGRPGLYRLTVDQASAYRIDVMSSDGDPIVEIASEDDPYAPLDTDDDGGVGTDARLDVILDPGVYYLSVRNFSPEAGSFALLVQLLR